MFLPAPPNFQKKKLAEEIQNLDPWPPKYTTATGGLQYQHVNNNKNYKVCFFR